MNKKYIFGMIALLILGFILGAWIFFNIGYDDAYEEANIEYHENLDSMGEQYSYVFNDVIQPDYDYVELEEQYNVFSKNYEWGWKDGFEKGIDIKLDGYTDELFNEYFKFATGKSAKVTIIESDNFSEYYSDYITENKTGSFLILTAFASYRSDNPLQNKMTEYHLQEAQGLIEITDEKTAYCGDFLVGYEITYKQIDEGE